MRVHVSLLSFIILPFCTALASALTRIVDNTNTYQNDRQDGVQYSPGWISSPLNTLHYTQTPGSSLIYFFQGNAVHYTGDQGPHAAMTIWIDGVLCPVDASEGTTQTQVPIWSREDLGPGDHEIVIMHEGSGNSVSLDYLRVEYEESYLPLVSGPAASMVPSAAMVVDNTGLDMIEYSPPTSWSTTAGTGAFNGSLHTTTQSGAVVTFKFNGMAVWYFSNTNVDHGKVHISLDGTVGTTITGFSAQHLNQRLLWSATDLADGEHTVTITHVDTEGKLMTMDFLMYLPSSPVVATITSTVIVSPLPTAAEPRVRPQASTTSEHKIYPSVILGCSLGGLALLGLLGLVVRLRHARARRQSLDLLDDCKTDRDISPYGYSSPYITVEATSSAVFSEPAESVRPLMFSSSYLTLPHPSRYSIIPAIGSPAIAYRERSRSRSSSISSDGSIISMPRAYR